MRLFLASDVLFSQRVDPYISQVLVDHGIDGQSVEPSQFLPDDTWLNADTVGEHLGVAGAADTSNAGGVARPGTHGHGLIDVKVGDQTLAPAPATNRITANAATAFTVDFQNQGDNNEFDVPVTLVAVGDNGAGTPIKRTKQVGETFAGQQTSIPIRLGPTLPKNPVSIKVTIGKVLGEKTTTNNTLTYVVLFQ